MIRFAPVKVPWRRRRQTMAVLILLIVLPITAVLLNVICIYYWQLLPLYFLYILWIYLDKSPQTGTRWHFLRKNIRSLNLWSHFADYFPAKLIKTADLPEGRPYIFGFHPHGLCLLFVSIPLLHVSFRYHMCRVVGLLCAHPFWLC